MATTLTVRANVVNADNDYQTSPASYLQLDLDHDYFIWTTVDATVKDGMLNSPLESELNNAATLIDGAVPVTVPNCLVMDYSHSFVAGQYTQEVDGMGDNKKFVFCFSFNGTTATEPQLEGWDDSTHASKLAHALGNNTPANSFVKGVCTTGAFPGAGWAGAAIAGSSNVLLLNDGNGALGTLPSGQVTQELFCNLKIVIPAAYSTPASETFVLTCRYSWN